MKKAIIFLVLLLNFSLIQAADSWRDPSWKEMLAKADLVALIEYTGEGEFKAPAKILKVYKGEIAHPEIWISGFSNRYGPIDEVSPGEQYLVFLYHNEFSEDDIEFYDNMLKENPDRRPYYDAWYENRSYYVQTPTSGDLRVNGNTVQYDLNQTSHYNAMKYYSLEEFERFLDAVYKDSEKYQQYVIKQFEKDNTGNRLAQLINMLYLTGYQTYHDFYEPIVDSEKFGAEYALAKLLGQIEDPKATNLLLRLLDSRNTVVQGEVVRQLSKQPAEIVGPVLVSKLPQASDGGSYPRSIMDPVSNSLDGGQIQIIKTLGELGYEPAIPALLPLLRINSEYKFNYLMESLLKLGSKPEDYVPYLIEHIENPESKLIFRISNLIEKLKLVECLPAMMNYISSHDRYDHPSKEYTVSTCCGIGGIDTPEVRAFLLKDFETVMQMDASGHTPSKLEWIREYTQTFTELEISDIKPKLYDALKDFNGIDHSFKLKPERFEQKKLWDSIVKNRIQGYLEGYTYKDIHIWADYNYEADEVTYDELLINVVLIYNGGEQGSFDAIKNALLANGIAEEQISLSKGNLTNSYGGRVPPEFFNLFLWDFLDYLVVMPDAQDVVFMENLFDYIKKDDYETRRLSNDIDEAKKNLK